MKLSGISKKRTRLYEDFTEGILDEEEYVFAKKAYDEQYANLSRRLDEAVQRKVKFAEAMSEDNKWLTLMKSVSGCLLYTSCFIGMGFKPHRHAALFLSSPFPLLPRSGKDEQ